jgi:hypothetical protein
MPIDREVQNRWLLGQPIAPASFHMCQSVRVIAGPHQGEVGELISLAELLPEPLYHLETSNNEDLFVLQSQLAPVNA